MARKKTTTKKTKLPDNWRSKTIEWLERDYWGEPEYPSHLVTTCHRLRKKPIKDFETEDLRIMIGQSIGLTYLIPVALEVLTDNIFADGDFYEGDLLQSVLKSDSDFWKANPDKWTTMCELFQQNSKKLEEHSSAKSIKREWFERFEKFEKLN